MAGIVVQVVKKVGAENDWDFKPDKELRRTIEQFFGEGLESYVHKILTGVCLAIGKDVSIVDDFVVRILADSNPKTAYSFKRPRDDMKSNPKSPIPDMIIGFANDPIEFEKNIIHETLHCLWWDEDMVESKTQELYMANKGEK